MFSRKTAQILAASLALIASGCDSDPAGLSDPPLKSFLLTDVESFQIEPGDNRTVVATKNGVAATGVTWATGNAAVATVDAAGKVTAVASGDTYVTATLGSEVRHVTVSVPVLQGTAITKGTPVAIAAAAYPTIKIYRLFVPAGTTSLNFTTAGGTGDADLYVRQGAPATINTTTGASANAACISGGLTTAETCTIANPVKGSWYASIMSWDYSGAVTLTGTYTP
ncbi:MAG TPA: pre-peptidase C-terminal domain-containing protein [Vicinamibacterales bacterium]|nr:pre-peptidase C-terminal domain-containing protein [Vicinamibacterales bacterium]